MNGHLLHGGHWLTLYLVAYLGCKVLMSCMALPVKRGIKDGWPATDRYWQASTVICIPYRILAIAIALCLTNT
jgi:hypothetical protein